MTPRLRMALVALVTAAALVGALRVEVDAGALGLLRPDAPEVLEANGVRESIGAGQLVVALSGLEADALEPIADELAERARATTDVEHAHAAFATEWFAERAVWSMTDADVEALAAGFEELATIAEERASGLSLGLDGAREAELIEAMEEVSGRAPEGAERVRFASADGRYRFVLIVPAVRVTDVERTGPLLESLEGIASDLERAHPGLETRFTGKLALVQEQQRVLERDLMVTSLAALSLCVLVMALVLRSARAPLVIGGAVALAALWTLGFAGFFAGPLNLITAMLFPVLAGLGVDFGIHIALDLRRVRRSEPCPTAAMRRVVRDTRAPALAAALTTAAAFGALSFAELQGLAQIGWLAPVGVLCSLAATYLIVPPLLVRVRANAPAPSRSPALAAAPRGRAWIVLACAALLAAFAASSLGALRFENDYRLLSADSDSDAFFEYVDAELDLRFDPTVVVVATEDLSAARGVLEARRREASSRTEEILGLDDFLPNTSPRHRGAVSRLRAALERPTLADQERLEAARALAHAQPWSVAELPEVVRDRFVTRDGERAVLLVFGDERIQSDSAALRWVDELEVLRAALDVAGIEHALSNEALLPAWVFSTLIADGARLLGLAGGAVAAFVLVYFVRLRGARGLLVGAAVLLSLGAGLLVGLGLLAALGVPLTTFNLAVVPCVIGIGVDDLVHLGHRVGRRGVGAAVREVAPAIALTSVTTLIGFGVTQAATHPGLRTVAPVGAALVVCTTFAALLLLPALMRLVRPEVSR